MRVGMCVVVSAGYDKAWTIEFPFPVRVYQQQYQRAGVASSGNLQFTSSPYGWQVNPTISSLPANQFGTCLFAFGTFSRTTRVQSGVMGEAPNRIFVIDWQAHRGYTGAQLIRLQYLLYESGNHVAVSYSGIELNDPWSYARMAVALQSSQLELATAFRGRLTESTRLDYQVPELRFSGVSAAPFCALTGVAQVTLVQPADVDITQSTDYTLTCTSTTAINLTFPLRLCAADAACTPLTIADFSTATVTEPTTYTCTPSFVGLTSLVYALPVAFSVTLLPRLTCTNEWSLTVSGPVGFPTRVYANADAINSPIEVVIQAGERAAVGVDPISLTHWMKGSNCRLNEFPAGHVEPNGAASDANTPSPRAYALSWSGKDGHLYFYSGESTVDFPSDLWRYSRTSGQWSQLPSPTSNLAVHGIRGQSSTEATPGQRRKACSVVDDVGDLWLFGTSQFISFHCSAMRIGGMQRLTSATGNWELANVYLGNGLFKASLIASHC